MTPTIRIADFGDLDLLVELRREVLRAANNLVQQDSLDHLTGPVRRYYEEAFQQGQQRTYLLYVRDALAACATVCRYRVLPTCDNPSGECMALMNLYTRPAYRRMGFARRLVDRVVADARGSGAGKLVLEATAMGRPLYEQAGFSPAENDMELFV